MNKTEQHHSTKKLVDDLSKVKTVQMTEDDLDTLLIKVLSTGYGSSEKFSLDETIDIYRKRRSSAGDAANQLFNYFNKNQEALNSAFDLCKQAEISELKAHRRSLRYRIYNTLAIGFSIMIVYAVAHVLGIPMPLMKLPV